jgi:hypothetical protein
MKKRETARRPAPKPPSRKVGNNRLLRLADYLRTVPRKEFDIRVWESSCGTIACAMGHATRMPFFRRLGARTDHIYGDISIGIISGGFRVASRLFGIDDPTAVFLFSTCNVESAGGVASTLSERPTPKEVARHIEKWVAAHPPAAS